MTAPEYAIICFMEEVAALIKNSFILALYINFTSFQLDNTTCGFYFGVYLGTKAGKIINLK